MPSLREQVADLERRIVRDYDPEDDGYLLRPSDGEESEREGEDLRDDFSRAHYETVEKSRLRQPEQPTLDAKYGGVAVSRKALEDDGEDDDDPFAPVEEEEDDPFAPVEEEEDDPFAARNGGDMPGSEGVSEEENDNQLGSDVDQDEDSARDETVVGEDYAKRIKKRKGVSGEDYPRDEAERDGSDLSEEHSLDESDVSMDDDEASSSISSAASPPPPRAAKPSRSADREELRKAAFDSASTAALASALSAGAAADVKKGQAVKRQRQTFDRLLDARIKFQKGLTAMNELPPPGSLVDEEEVKTAAKQAEDAALALWSTIDSIRSAILSAREEQQGPPSSPGDDGDNKTEKQKTDLKRKRQPLNATRTTPLSEMWERYTSLEAHAHTHRRGVMDKWHAKTQPVLDPAPRSKLLKPSSSSSSRLTDVLDTYLATESSKLVAQSYSPSTQTYDDGAFYQSLLRDLVASRSSSSSSPTVVLPTKLHVSGSKHKRGVGGGVDTKASKGRKVRYTVHEKLENFMAPEDRSTWTESARHEFFGSLLGARIGALDERERSDDAEGGVDGILADGDGDEDTGEVEALRLFRR
ncbi:uncharacterized protein Z520_07821 [Fonsecaea multimorphosa CBS 102226]|uniref:Protein BFR2 n=1 Tax=Fonsecaea multimorphosa CBS 102226 TaxID=1442371 RepID=A0A0D2H3Y7_9EURO|nr:uncharacterized protein Z520_07821 [Fonsecaea multimorphosa CBS 102226]KIX96555.1 hypothetical protein Z520_07821 [Fonsecaea multimorphosa CBS 102226]OAL22168.1 hypothetical protein AYO22_07429 [Fonsecaea multimorphosa]